MENELRKKIQALAADMDDSQIRISISTLQEVLDSRNPTDTIKISWKGRIDDIRKGRPYFAIITAKDGKMNHEFVSKTVYDSRKENTGATAMFNGELRVGTIVRHRSGSSWKNDYQVFSAVTWSGLEEIDEIDARERLGLL